MYRFYAEFHMAITVRAWIVYLFAQKHNYCYTCMCSFLVYIDAGLGQSNPIILTTITSGPKFPRSWRIRISQIHCGSIYKADQGCLQYFTGVSGRLRSFNFDPSSGRQLSNQDYSLCIRMERNFCSIQYTACSDPAGTNRSRSFSLSG